MKSIYEEIDSKLGQGVGYTENFHQLWNAADV